MRLSYCNWDPLRLVRSHRGEPVELQVELGTSTTLDTGKGGKGMLIETGVQNGPKLGWSF